MEAIQILLRQIGFSISFSSGKKLLRHAIDLCSEEQD
jgi:hypothetical protein